MPISLQMMQAAASSGLSVVCATCENYWNAREKGIVGDRCLSKSNCGSPFAGGTFHEYRGALTDDRFAACCFVCGDAATHRIKRPNARSIGICLTHLAWMSDPTMRDPVPAKITDKVERNYLGLDAADLAGRKLPPEQSLMGVILKTEKEWADQDGKPFDLSLLGEAPKAPEK